MSLPFNGLMADNPFDDVSPSTVRIQRFAALGRIINGLNAYSATAKGRAPPRSASDGRYLIPMEPGDPRLRLEYGDKPLIFKEV
jgi:hypothetical protein